MIKHIKNKILTVFLVLTLFLFLYFKKDFVDASNGLVSTSNFYIFLEENSKLGFQHDHILIMEVISGNMNGTNATIHLTGRSGTLSFISSNTSTIEVSCSNDSNGFRYDTEGITSTIQTDTFTYQSIIPDSTQIVIHWSWNQYSFVDEYFMLGVGVFGITLMVFAPTWTAFQVIKKAYDFETVKRIGYSLFLFIIGFGLFITWLWPT